MPIHPDPHQHLPLCVDLDGTLVKSDTLVDSVLALARQKPRALLSIPSWLAQGKAAFKRHVAQSVQLDVESLPYNHPLMDYLKLQYAAGRPLYLATAADRTLADRVAAHLGIFAETFASDGAHNLAGDNKLHAFQQRFGQDFSYIGNATPDLPILTVCRQPMVANPSKTLMAGLRSAHIVPAHIFRDRPSSLKAWLKAIRLHQWAKNTLIFVPLLLAHTWRGSGAAASLAGAALAFLAFGLCASATYIVNDLLDIEADRRHPTKRRRPFAGGNLPAQAGVVVVAGFLAASVLLAVVLPMILAAMGSPLHSPHAILKWLLVYFISTTAYSLALKRVVLVDVIVLSGLYTVRILAGSAATSVPVSTWLGGFSVFFFLSLAFVKRFAELEGLRLRGAAPSNGRGYLVTDIEQLRSFGTSAAYASVVVLTLYISSLDTILYNHPGRLWLLASRGELNEDPVVYAITDKRSLLLGVVVVGVVLSAL